MSTHFIRIHQRLVRLPNRLERLVRERVVGVLVLVRVSVRSAEDSNDLKGTKSQARLCLGEIPATWQASE
jgi:hypothetical protein